MAETCLGRSPNVYVEAVLGYVGVGVPDLLAGEARKVLISGNEEERRDLISY